MLSYPGLLFDDIFCIAAAAVWIAADAVFLDWNC